MPGIYAQMYLVLQAIMNSHDLSFGYLIRPPKGFNFQTQAIIRQQNEYHASICMGKKFQTIDRDGPAARLEQSSTLTVEQAAGVLHTLRVL